LKSDGPGTAVPGPSDFKALADVPRDVVSV
jgi:hypothetical protein